MSVLSLLSFFVSAGPRGSGNWRAAEMRASHAECMECSMSGNENIDDRAHERRLAAGMLTQTDVLMLTDFAPVSFLSDRCRD